MKYLLISVLTVAGFSGCAASVTDSVTDSDLDGLADARELLLETDPNNDDTDGDRVLDGAEVLVYKTDPLNPDTDGDGLSDGVEVGAFGDSNPISKTDPLDKDTDGDGVCDGGEDSNHNGEVDEGESDPNEGQDFYEGRLLCSITLTHNDINRLQVRTL